MAKDKRTAPNISTLQKYLKKDSLLPVYFFFGEDTYSIEAALRAIEDLVRPMLDSEFDREVISGKDKTITEVLDLASSFPFGSGKRLIVFKDFDADKKNKKALSSYVKDPPSFTVLVIIKYGNISSLESEPYTILCDKNYIFECKEPKRDELVSWIEKEVARKHKAISPENAALLLSIAGENRSLLEMQLQKIYTYMGDSTEITHDTILKQSSSLKEFNIFDLQNAIGAMNKSRAMEIAYNLLDRDKEGPVRSVLVMLTMLTRYFFTLARILELENDRNKPHEKELARLADVHPYYYKDYRRASFSFGDKRLFKAGRALLEADLAMKTSQSDPKTIVTMLISRLI